MVKRIGSDADSIHLALRELGFSGEHSVRDFQQAWGLPASGILDDATRHLAIDAAVARRIGQRHDLDEPCRAVTGRVATADGTPAPDLVVEIFVQSFRRENKVGTARTDSAGRYEVPYARGATESGKNAVIVRVFDGNEVAATSEPIYDAPVLAELDFIVDGSHVHGPSEYEKLLGDVRARIGSVAIEELKEDANQRDLEFLSGTLGAPIDNLIDLVMAHRLSAASSIEPAYFYALLRENAASGGDPAKLEARFRIDLDTSVQQLLFDLVLLDPTYVHAAVKRAVDARIVAAGINVDENIKRLAVHTDEARSYFQNEQPRAVLAALAANLAAGKHNEVLAALAAEHGGDPASLIEMLAEIELVTPDGSRQPMPRDATRAFGSLIAADPKLLESLSALSPSGRAASHAPAPRATRAATAALRSDIERMSGEHRPALPHRDALVSLLREHPDLDLAADDLDTRLNGRTNITPEVRAGLKATQRVFKLAPTLRQTSALLQAGMHSAAQVAATGETRFVKEMARTGSFTADEARGVFRRAVDVHTASAFLAAELRGLTGAATVSALAGPAVSEKLQVVAGAHPNLKNLFERIDQCECKECRSITSPAAYLVDVLQFFKHRLVVDTTVTPPVASNTARDVLFARRPDLGDIDLSCDNTNVPLPYIDVVCELLEQAVAPDPGFTFNGALAAGIVPAPLLAALQAQELPFTSKAYVQGPDLRGNYVVRDEKIAFKLEPTAPNAWLVRRMRQTFASAEELAAAPAYVNDVAYQTLQTSQIAFHLPFDLYHQESLGYFARFDVRRDELMRALQTGGTPAARDLAAETLGLTDVQRDLVATADAAGQNVYWNTGAQPASTVMNVVDTFLTRTELGYSDLTDMLDCAFINPGNTLFIQHLDSTCDTAQKRIANLDDAALDRIHRFLRLRNVLGWRSATLDHAITALHLGNGQLDDACLIALGDLVRLRRRLGKPIDDLIAWFGTIPPARYAQIFLSPTRNGTIDPNLTIAAVAANELAPPATQKHLGDVAASLSLALGVSSTDLALLIAAAVGSDVLSFANLAWLFGQIGLAKALGRSIADLVRLERLIGLDALTSPAGALRFIEESDRIASAGIKPADLQFLLAFTADDLATRELSDDAVRTLLEQLQRALQSAFDDNRSPFDASKTADEHEDALRELVSKLAGATPTQVASLVAIVRNEYTSTASTFLDELLGSSIDTTPIKAWQAMLAATPSSPPGPFEAARLALVQALLDALAQYFHDSARESAIEQVVGEGLRLDPDLAHILVENAGVAAKTIGEVLGDDGLIDTVHSPPQLPAITKPAFPDAFAAVRLLRHVGLFAAAMHFDKEDVAWLLAHAPALGWLELDQLPYESGLAAVPYVAWSELWDAVSLWRRYPDVENPVDAAAPFTLRSVFELALGGATTTEILDRLALVTGWDPQVLTDLEARFSLAYTDPAALLQLEAAVVPLRRLGLSVADGVTLIKPQLIAADAALLRQALKTRYDESQWLGVLKTIMDPLRQLKRDALVAYLLANNPDFRSSDDLFEYFLVDVEMCSCQPTSRIVSAHGTLQLFAKRCLLGIEPTAVADTAEDDGWKQWSWMENYRVWQANRQVFLYPENWIDPPLRDDKSQPFVELENTLAQNELTDDVVTDATAAYLQAVDDIAFLEVVTTYYEQRNFTMHVFARTKGGDPPTYYYRRFIEERSWTPWEKVDLDIKGDHLIAFIRNSRLNLAWPIFNEQPNEQQSIPLPSSADAGKETEKTQKYWKVQLACSEYVNGQWVPSRTSKGALDWWPGFYEQLPQRETFRFVPMDLRQGGFSILSTFVDNGRRSMNNAIVTNPATYYLGGFQLTGCKGYPEPFQGSGLLRLVFLPLFKDTAFRDLRHVELGADATDDLTIITATLLRPVEILGKTPGTFKVTWPQQVSIIDYILILVELLQRTGGSTGRALARADYRTLLVPLGTFMPYFYEDGHRGYVAIPGYFSGPVIEWGGPGAPPQIRRTFSDVLRIVEEIITLAKVYLQKLQQDPSHDLQKLLQQLVQDPAYVDIREELAVFGQLQYFVDFQNFYHPLVCSLRKTFYADGIAKLMERGTQLQTTPFDFGTTFDPKIVKTPYPIEDIDFASNGSYASYNWELFFHLPFSVATQLSQAQQYEKALEWFHYIFNPADASTGTVPQKYWRTKPFFLTTSTDYVSERIDRILSGIASDPSGTSIDDLRFAVSQWRENPFKPFLIARTRTVAFQQAVLMKYLDNLIAWGDSLFSQDTMESVNQATQMYVLANKLLGPKPRIVPPAVTPPPETFSQLEAKIDLFGNALLDLENLIPDLSLLPHGGAELPPSPLTLSSLYFCCPPNSNLLQYWDTIDDRLFKIRHCQDINGVERTLALFAPPIDPGALVRATAAGLSVADLLAALNAPLPFYRFNSMITKATELTQLVSSLGNAILSALEKRDSEALQRLRSDQEIRVLNAVRAIKEQQIADTQTQIEALQRSIDLTTAKSQYYHSRPFMNAAETVAMALNGAALLTQGAAIGLDASAAVMKLMPEFAIGGAGFGGSPQFDASFGGENISGAMSGFAEMTRGIAGVMQSGAGMAATLASYQRRQEEWDFQATLADKELLQLGKQMEAVQIRLDIAQKELATQKLQIENAKQADQFLRSKFTNKELYDYMVGQLSGVYFRAYKLALDVAHKAERCLQHELGTDKTFIQNTYWDNQKKGLLAGDRLLGDLKQMEVSYLSQNKREYELTKNVSLAQLDPLALLQLKTTGACTFSLPEAIFDLDHPGQYFRRLKSVGVTVPCVAGPYTQVGCKLSLVGNRYRKNTELVQGAATDKDKYAEVPGNDDRFTYSVGSIQSISTSQALNDNGLFELNFRDERYLPFEGAGAVSSWRLELPATFKQFDYGTITDVVLQVRYTARDGGSSFRSLVEGVLGELLEDMLVDAQNSGLYQGFDLRREFPNEWYRLQQSGTVQIEIGSDRLPFFTKGHAPTIQSATWLGRVNGNPASYALKLDGSTLTLSKDTDFGGLCKGGSNSVTLDTPFALASTNVAALQDLALVIHYTLEA